MPWPRSPATSVDLPAGPFQFAAGTEYRRTKRTSVRTRTCRAATSWVSTRRSPSKARSPARNTSPSLRFRLLKDIPAIESLDLELGYRFSDYNLCREHRYLQGRAEVESGRVAVGAWVVQPCDPCAEHPRAAPAAAGKLPAVHRPLQREQLVPYGSRARRRWSALCQAQGIPAANFLTTFAQPNPQAHAIVGGNPDLDPETADTIHRRRGVELEPRERLGEQPAGGGRLLRLPDRGRDLVADLELDHRPMLQPAGRQSDVRHQQLVLPAVHP